MSPIREGVGSLVEGDMQQINSLLGAFTTDAQAYCAALVDRSGRLLAAAVPLFARILTAGST